MLQMQFDIMREPDANPFASTDLNVEEAYPPTLELVDSDLKLVKAWLISSTDH